MNLGSMQTALTSWVEKYAGVPCEWGRLPQEVHLGASVLAYLGPITKLGHDERVQTYNAGDDTTSVRVVGVRRVPVRLSFRSIDQRLGGSARQYAERLRAEMHETSSFADLRDADLSLVDSTELVESDYEWSNRMVSQVDMTIYFGARASFTDPNHDGSYIGTVNYNSAPYIVDEYGVPVNSETGETLVPE